VATAGDSVRGKDLFALAGGCGCHTPENGPVGAGGRALPTPFGTFFASNITSDKETGIGAWSDAEITAAIRLGDLRDGGVEAPVMPYAQYAGMADQDVADLVAYLRTLPPARNPNRAPETTVPIPRLAYRAWRWWFTEAGVAPAAAPADAVERGRYLTEHVAICGDCHTPRARFGTLRGDRYLAGTRHGPDGKSVPNITPDDDTGIGEWSADDVTEVLQSGMLPDFDNVQGLMAEVVDGIDGGAGYKDAPVSELKNIAAYLKTVHPIVHDVRDK
jgi:mono/diheme cytochrome c family protein